MTYRVSGCKCVLFTTNYLCLEGRRCNAAIKPSAIAGIRRRRKGQKVQIVSSLNNLQFLTFGVHCTLTDIAEA